MKKLTKKERNNIYKKALKLHKSHSHYGLCTLIMNSSSFKRTLNDCKELVLFKPHEKFSDFSFWFNYNTDEQKDIKFTRKLILDFCIEMTN